MPYTYHSTVQIMEV